RVEKQRHEHLQPSACCLCGNGGEAEDVEQKRKVKNPRNDSHACRNDCGSSLPDWKYSPTFRSKRISMLHLCTKRRGNCPIAAFKGSLVYWLRSSWFPLRKTPCLLYDKFYLRTITSLYQGYFSKDRLF